MDAAKEESAQSNPEVRHKHRMETLQQQLQEMESTEQTLQTRKLFSLLILCLLIVLYSELTAELDTKKASLEQMRQRQQELQKNLEIMKARHSFVHT